VNERTLTDSDILNLFTVGMFCRSQGRRRNDCAPEVFYSWLAEHDRKVIREFRLKDLRKLADAALQMWDEYGDVNDMYMRDGLLEQIKELEDESVSD
jgi:hypothetical protein